MKSYFSSKIYYYYYGGRYSFRSQPINLINVIKLFVLKISMASFLCTCVFLIQNPNVFDSKPIALGLSSSCLVMGLGFLYLVNRKLVRMRI